MDNRKNLELLKNKDFDLVDWENVIEELESIKRKVRKEIGLVWKSAIRKLVKWFEDQRLVFS